jgi:hypothetical protein
LEPLDYGDPTLVGLWTFDEGSGSIAYDYSGNNATGTLISSPIWSNGKIGSGSLNFTGAGFVKIPNTSGINSITSIATVSVWIKTSSTAEQEVFSAFSSPSSQTGYQAQILAGGQASLWDNSKGNLTENTTIIDDGNWHQMVAVWNGTNRLIYVDGILATSGTETTFTTSPYDNQIGTQCSGAGSTSCSGSVNGLIDNVRVYNRALSATQIAAMYNGGK